MAEQKHVLTCRLDAPLGENKIWTLGKSVRRSARRFTRAMSVSAPYLGSRNDTLG